MSLFGTRFTVDQEITDLALGAEVRYFFAGDSVGIEGVAGYSFGGRFGLEARYDTVSNFKGFQLLASVRFGD